MPRGPGKKENYNLNYSRFNAFDRDEEEDQRSSGRMQQAAANGNDSIPPMEEILANVPGELREAYRLMAESKQTGDEAAQKRANELCLAAVERGGPEVRKKFLDEVSRQMPEEGQKWRDKGLFGDGVGAGVGAGATTKDMPGRIDHLRKKMEKDAEDARAQLESLASQQEQLEKLQSPEDFMKFMSEQGMGNEDLQRMFTGDQQHMENFCQAMIDKAAGKPKTEQEDPEETLKAAEELHASLCGLSGKGAPPPSTSSRERQKAGDAPESGRLEAEKTAAAVPKKPVEEPVKIPDHRLQYQKDAEGRYSSVELRCDLPGVADMSSIMLDISEKYLRLTTSAPGPKYAVNAGPFPVLIDASAARAKFSKKRSELSVTVPAKPDS
jgi:hypothetical protein